MLVVEVLQSGLEVEEVYFEGELDPQIAELASLGTVIARPVLDQALAAVLDTVSPQNVVAVVESPSWSLKDIAKDRPILVLVEVRDPGNVGTLIRTAEAAGFGGVVLSGESVDPTNPKVVRAAAGAFFRLPVLTVGDPLALFDDLRSQNRPVVVTVVDKPEAGQVVAYDRLDLRTAAIVLGNEAHGLAPELVSAAGTLTTIPLAGPTESLNVAAAGAVLCFTSWRQRRTSTDPKS